MLIASFARLEPAERTESRVAQTLLFAKPVLLAITVTAVTQLPRHVEIAQRVTTTTTLVKDPVCHAVPVNSMMLLVLIIVHHVLKTLITGIKQGHQVAYHVRMVRRRKKVAPNVNLVKQECLVRVLVKTVKVAMLDNTVQVKC